MPPNPPQCPQSRDPLHQLIADFLGADTENAEALRLRYCPRCQASAESDATAEERDAACHFWRCHLRDPAKLRAEQFFVGALHNAGIQHGGGRPDPHAIKALSDLIDAAGCITPAIVPQANGRFHVLPFSYSTLRGCVHFTLLNQVGRLNGVDVIDVHTMTAAQVRDRIGKQRDVFEARDTLERHREWARMRDQKVSDYAIAKAHRISLRAISKELGPAQMWEENRAEWWRDHGGEYRT